MSSKIHVTRSIRCSPSAKPSALLTKRVPNLFRFIHIIIRFFWARSPYSIHAWPFNSCLAFRSLALNQSRHCDHVWSSCIVGRCREAWAGWDYRKENLVNDGEGGGRRPRSPTRVWPCLHSCQGIDLKQNAKARPVQRATTISLLSSQIVHL